MKLSVVVLNYNTKDLTLACLQSMDKYPYDKYFEVIVVDNNSTDGSVKTIRSFKPKKYKLVLIENNTNVGFSKGNNIGIKKAKGEYILLLNSDTLLTKNALNELMEFPQKKKNVGVIAPRLLNKDGTTQKSVFRLPTMARAVKQYLFKKEGLLDKYAPNTKKPVEVESVVGAALLITPKTLKKVGLLDARYFMYFEDLDYCRRVRAAGLLVYYLPKTKIVHIHGASGKGSAAQYERLKASSKIYHGALKYYLLTAIIKIGTKLSLTALALALAVLCSLILRFLYFPDNIYFAYDQSRDAFMASEILTGNLKLLGPPTSLSGLFHGPLYWYLIAPLYLVFNGSPAYVAGVIRALNVVSVVLIYLVGTTISGKKIGLAAAFIYAFSFENWQEAQYFTNPGPAVVTSLLFYLGLARIAKGKDKLRDWLFVSLGLGFSIQLQFYLLYLFVSFFAILVIFRKRIVGRIESKKMTVFVSGLAVALSTFIVSEFKFQFRIIKGLLTVFTEQQNSKPLVDKSLEWLDKILVTIKDSLGFSLQAFPKIVVAILIVSAFVIIYSKAHQKTKDALNFLGVWIASTAILYIVIGHNTYYIIGLAPGLILLFVVLLRQTSFLRLFWLPIIALVIVLNTVAIAKQAKAGIITQISVQEGMRYGDEKKVLSYIYNDADTENYVVSALTMPYDIYSTWAYLFHNYGNSEYGYIPYWIKEPPAGYPGRLPVSSKTVCERYTIYESVRGLERLEEGFRREQDLTTELISTTNIGKFTVEKRFDKACL